MIEFQFSIWTILHLPHQGAQFEFLLGKRCWLPQNGNLFTTAWIIEEHSDVIIGSLFKN